MTHLKRQKLISSTQVRRYNTVLIISTAPELMKLIFAVLDVSLTMMGLTRCYKTEGFYIYICGFCTYFTLFLLDTLV